MSTDEHATSYAKQVYFQTYKPNSLDRTPRVSEAFNDPSRRPDAAMGQGSGMVRDDAPEPSRKPPPPQAKATDRAHFNQRWNEEQFRAYKDSAYARAVYDRMATQQSQEAAGPSRDNDMGMGR